MPYLHGPDRTQTQLLPPSLEEYAAPDSVARLIEAFVLGLDMEGLGFTRARPSAKGRPGYDPRDLLKLYLYGYFNRIRSSRRLEAEAGRNVELMWLLRSLRPDYKTIADFRRDHIGLFKGVFREFNLLCRKMDLFAAELVAIDGSKFKASNNFRKSYDHKQLKEALEKIETGIAKYLEALDRNDEEAEGAGRVSRDGVGGPRDEAQHEARREQFAAKLARLEQDKRAMQALLQEFEEQQEQGGPRDISRVDRDARRMKRGNGAGTLVGYNVQVAVDGKHGLIVAEDVVTQPNDLNELAAMTQAALQTLNVGNDDNGNDDNGNDDNGNDDNGNDDNGNDGNGNDDDDDTGGVNQVVPMNGPMSAPVKAPLRVLADSGYNEADQLTACEALGVEPCVPRPRKTQGQGAADEQGNRQPVFAKDLFRYDAARNVYICPAQQVLEWERDRVHHGKLSFYYRTKACTSCPLRSQCTTANYRIITRRATEGAVERARERVKASPGMMVLRHALIERVFGTMRLTGHDQFLLRGWTKVRGEFSLSSLTYNLRRCINILGVPQILEALQAQTTSPQVAST